MNKFSCVYKENNILTEKKKKNLAYFAFSGVTML